MSYYYIKKLTSNFSNASQLLFFIPMFYKRPLILFAFGFALFILLVHLHFNRHIVFPPVIIIPYKLHLILYISLLKYYV